MGGDGGDGGWGGVVGMEVRSTPTTIRDQCFIASRWTRQTICVKDAVRHPHNIPEFRKCYGKDKRDVRAGLQPRVQ